MVHRRSDWELNKGHAHGEKKIYLRGGRTTEFSVRKVEGAERDWSQEHHWGSFKHVYNILKGGHFNWDRKKCPFQNSYSTDIFSQAVMHFHICFIVPFKFLNSWDHFSCLSAFSSWPEKWGFIGYLGIVSSYNTPMLLVCIHRLIFTRKL